MSDSDNSDNGSEDTPGYRNPPKATRYRKGQSGHKEGRPPGSHRKPPYEAVLGRIVTIREDGVKRQVTAEEAFLLRQCQRGLEGDSRIAGEILDSLESATIRREIGVSEPPHFVVNFVRPGSVTTALLILRMAVQHDRYRKTGRMALEPWIVEAALARLGDRRLTPEEQRIVVDATRTPHKVKWPRWWTERPSRSAKS
jgi:hypothetical protein